MNNRSPEVIEIKGYKSALLKDGIINREIVDSPLILKPVISLIGGIGAEGIGFVGQLCKDDGKRKNEKGNGSRIPASRSLEKKKSRQGWVTRNSAGKHAVGRNR